MTDTEVVFNAVKFRLVAKNATRWNSLLFSLQSLVKALDADPQIQSRLNATKDNKRKLSAVDIKILKEIILILIPFQEATDELQGDYETIGSVIPVYLDLSNKVSLTSFNVNGNFVLNPDCPLAGKISHCKGLVEALKASLHKRLSYVLNDTVYILGWCQKQSRITILSVSW